MLTGFWWEWWEFSEDCAVLWQHCQQLNIACCTSALVGERPYLSKRHDSKSEVDGRDIQKLGGGLEKDPEVDLTTWVCCHGFSDRSGWIKVGGTYIFIFVNVILLLQCNAMGRRWHCEATLGNGLDGWRWHWLYDEEELYDSLLGNSRYRWRWLCILTLEIPPHHQTGWASWRQ